MLFLSLYVCIKEFRSTDPGANAFTGSLMAIGVLKKAFDITIRIFNKDNRIVFRECISRYAWN